MMLQAELSAALIKRLQPFKTLAKMRVIFTLTLMLTIFLPFGQAQDRNIDGVIMPGIYMEELDDSSTFTTYDKVIPLVFEFKIPSSISNSQIPLGFGNILPRLVCRNENVTSSVRSTNDWLFTCPIFYHVNSLLAQFRVNWTLSTSSSGPSSTASFRSSSSQQTFSSGSSITLDPDCSTQLRSWRGIDTRSDVGLASYKAIIEKCSTESYFEEQIQDYNTEMNAGVYEKMRDNMAAYFGNNGTVGPGNSGSGSDMIGILLGLQNLMLTQSHVEISRWTQAMSSCQNSLIPNSILKSSKLEKVLQQVRTKLMIKKYNFVFGTTSASFFTKLSKMKLVDCIFGQNSVFVQILLPIVKDTNVYKSLQIHQPKFLYNGDNLCYVNSNFEGKGSTLIFRKFIFEKTTKLLVETDCSGNSMCKFPDKSMRPSADNCLLAVLVGNIESIKSFCHLECEKIIQQSNNQFQYQQQQLSSSSGAGGIGSMVMIPNPSFPLIQRVDSDKFIVTLYAMSTILIKCENIGRLDELIPPQKYGAVEIILPCNCYLMFHSEKYNAHEPCASLVNSAQIHHILPIHMINSSIELPRFVNYNNIRYSSTNMNTRLRYLQQPRSRITIPNVTLFINMTFKEQDIVEVVDDKDDNDDDHEGEDGESDPNSGIHPQHFVNGSNRADFLASCESETQHRALWALLIVQGLIMISLTCFALFKFHGLNKRLDDCKYHGNSTGLNGVGVSFSAHHPSQVNLTEKY